jgi:hypothetical protein
MINILEEVNLSGTGVSLSECWLGERKKITVLYLEIQPNLEKRNYLRLSSSVHRNSIHSMESLSTFSSCKEKKKD